MQTSICHGESLLNVSDMECYQARVQGGGGGMGPAPPPLEIEKQRKKKVIKANFKLFHIYFATFFSRKYHFLCYFLSWAPPQLKSKKKKKEAICSRLLVLL